MSAQAIKLHQPKICTTVINGYSGQGATPSLGNPDLDPETSVNYELGFNYQPTDALNLTATAFFNQVEDEIISKTFSCQTNDCSNFSNKVTSY